MESIWRSGGRGVSGPAAAPLPGWRAALACRCWLAARGVGVQQLVGEPACGWAGLAGRGEADADARADQFEEQLPVADLADDAARYALADERGVAQQAGRPPGGTSTNRSPASCLMVTAACCARR